MQNLYFFVVTTLLASSLIASANERGTLIFEDDFERSESQEITDEIGKGWDTNSKKRAGGNKQVDLRDGAMYIYIHETADHGVSVTHPAEFTNGAVGVKFMLEAKSDSLGLNFADQTCKDVHAGHLFAARISTQRVLLQDLKTGAMNLELKAQRVAKTLTKEQKAMLKTKEKAFKHSLEVGKWYNLVATVNGETLSVSIEGKEVASFASPGIGHSTKKMLRLAIPKNVVVDDLKIWKK